MTDERLREAALNAKNALALTYTNVPADGGRPHWCHFATGHHDATCNGMLHTQDALRAALDATPEPPLDAPGDLNERRAWFVYEGTRIAAAAARAPIVPEPWEQREAAFRAQFLGVIERQMGPDRNLSPRELHEDWVRAYEAMGWRFGPVRDRDAKTHPDMVPYDDLGQLERDKDAVFVALCEIARQWVYDYDESPRESS